MHEEAYNEFVAHGCKVWYVDAEEIETKIKDLIVSQRANPHFEDLVRELILERDAFHERAAEVVASARTEEAEREVAYEKLATMAAKLAADSTRIARSVRARGCRHIEGCDARLEHRDDRFVILRFQSRLECPRCSGRSRSRKRPSHV